MRNKHKILLALLLLPILLIPLLLHPPTAIQANSSAFNDVNPNDWFYDYVNEIKGWGIISGNIDGTFAPNKTITRAEFAKMMTLYDQRVDQKIADALAAIKPSTTITKPTTTITKPTTTITKPTTTITPVVPAEKLTGKVGDELYSNGVKFKVTKYGIDVDKTSNYEGLTKDRAFFYISFTITNETDKEIIVHKNNMILLEPDGRETMAATFFGENTLADYYILSGKSYSGKLIYSFPAQGKVSYRLGFWESKPFEVELRNN